MTVADIFAWFRQLRLFLSQENWSSSGVDNGMNFWITLWRWILYDFCHAIPEVRPSIVFGRYDQIALRIYVAAFPVYSNPCKPLRKVAHFLIRSGDCQSARLVDKTPLVLGSAYELPGF